MLNDVHFPPNQAHSPVPRSPHRLHQICDRGPADAHNDRVRARLPSCTRSDMPEAIYGEPEDRGDSFNTIMSAVVLGAFAILVACLIGLTSI